MIMKSLRVECTECGILEEIDDSSEEWEECLEMEKCPKCLQRIADEL